VFQHAEQHFWLPSAAAAEHEATTFKLGLRCTATLACTHQTTVTTLTCYVEPLVMLCNNFCSILRSSSGRETAMRSLQIYSAPSTSATAHVLSSCT
jgi:hypothetical protein